MDKKDLYKIFAIGLVAVFVIEGIAIGLMNSKQPGSGNGQQGGDGSAASLSGTVTTNVTIVRYEPYLIVQGSGPLLDAAKQGLIESGVATYSVPSGNGLILNLKSSASAPSAAEKFEGTNATVYANAAISTQPKVRVEGDGVTTTAEGASFTMQMQPVYDEGAVVPATFTAQVSAGQLVSLSGFAFLPSFVQGVRVAAELLSASEEGYVEVPWEARAAARAIARNESSAAYKEKSFILVRQDATKQQLDAALAAGADYVTGTQAGLVSVRNDFVNRSRAESDLRAAGLEPEFPSSSITFADANASSGRAEEVAARISAAGYPSSVLVRRMAYVRLPQEIVQDGRAYRTGGLEFGFEQKDGNGTYLEIGFEAAGNRLTRLTSVRQLPALLQNASSATAGQAANGSG